MASATNRPCFPGGHPRRRTSSSQNSAELYVHRMSAASATVRPGRRWPASCRPRALTAILTRDPARAEPLTGQGVEVACADVRDVAAVDRALRTTTVVSAVHGFAGPGGVSPGSVDRDGNANLIAAAARKGAGFVLLSVVGASPDHPIGLFRAKHAAEGRLRASGVPWTIVRATAFAETWATIMAGPLRASGTIPVLGRGRNPINFVSAADVAALTARAVTDPGLRGQVLEFGGPDNLTFDDLAAAVQEAAAAAARSGTSRGPR